MALRLSKFEMLAVKLFAAFAELRRLLVFGRHNANIAAPCNAKHFGKGCAKVQNHGRIKNEKQQQHYRSGSAVNVIQGAVG